MCGPGRRRLQLQEDGHGQDQVHPGRAVPVHSITPSFLELNAVRLINLDRANDVSSHGRAVQVDSIKPSFLELNATRLINLDRANDVLSNGGAVQVDSTNNRIESAYGFSA